MRERILARVRAAASRREAVEHPGALAPEPPTGSPLDVFRERFSAAGGEVVVLGGEDDTEAWIREIASEFGSAAFGAGVPAALRPPIPDAEPDRAALGVSMARAAVAETGSLLLDGRDGRRAALLPPAHVVWVRSGDVVATLAEALASAPVAETSTLALHSGPSKSADIGGVLVTGVHGPGRVIAAIVSDR